MEQALACARQIAGELAEQAECENNVASDEEDYYEEETGAGPAAAPAPMPAPPARKTTLSKLPTPSRAAPPRTGSRPTDPAPSLDGARRTRRTLITDADILDIKTKRLAGASIGSLAAEYHVGNQRIWDALGGQPPPRAKKGGAVPVAAAAAAPAANQGVRVTDHFIAVSPPPAVLAKSVVGGRRAPRARVDEADAAADLEELREGCAMVAAGGDDPVLVKHLRRILEDLLEARHLSLREYNTYAATLAQQANAAPVHSQRSALPWQGPPNDHPGSGQGPQRPAAVTHVPPPAGPAGSNPRQPLNAQAPAVPAVAAVAAVPPIGMSPSLFAALQGLNLH